ncbi:NAD(P)-binding domain-containing protein [Nocardioides mangrovi]|uniref:NAD(P)-binding domain-containing protein n=1 Tax=Nocardioides mangrovi TaxID=2874580 RepID=A0ABS7U730_9ACTN|nr:NAD(P)-binding domain-containing protein [Nocardioides mangrovi]MBZ5736566.1 NAD(P)-binding domain-containing protein [Nocardioides mangrovi]
MTGPSSDVLVLDGAATDAALDPLDVLHAVRAALAAIAAGRVSSPPRIAARTPDGLLAGMPAYVADVGLAAKLVSIFAVPGADGADSGRSTHFGLVAVFDQHDGRPLAIMEGGRITAVRTAASATVSQQALAPEAERFAVVGAGVQARAQLDLLALVAPGTEVALGTRDPRSGERLASSYPGVRATTVHDAVREAEAVFLCTGATTPVIEPDWLAPHAHVSSVGGSQGHEVDAATVAAAAVYAEWPGAAAEPPPAGAHELQGVEGVRLIGSVLDAPPPRSGLTLYKSTGHAALDVAAGAAVLRRARSLGLGLTLTF